MIDEFKNTMLTSGIVCREDIIADGQIHRFANHGKGNKDGWYVFHGMAGAFGDWKQDIQGKWSVGQEREAYRDRELLHHQIEATSRITETETEQKQEEAARTALERWNSFSEIGSSSYLLTKKVDPFGVRFEGDSLVVPLKDTSGRLWSLQWIASDGTKRFLTGGRKKGCFHALGMLEEGKPIYVVEGYATGASVHMATGAPTVVAFDAGNLESVVEALRKAYSTSMLTIAGDDDRWKETNTGRLKAEEVAQKYNCSLAFPIFKNTETKPTDFNELHVLEGLDEVKRQLSLPSRPPPTLIALNVRDLLSMEMRPREMILTPILPEQGLVMIHAPRGIGKTHVSLQIAYTAATGGQMFQGKWRSDKPHKVLFIDGEMPLVVMQERLAKIVASADRDVSDDNLLIITPDLQKQGLVDLATLEGQQIIEEHLTNVNLLILDNLSALCRRGRENEAESWIPLQEWFLTLRRRGISVLLIHHSNKAGAQRGTSRKEDLLDTVITLRKPEDYDPRMGARFEVHYEKARGFYGEEAVPFEAWLKEEDGQFKWEIGRIEDPLFTQILTLHKEKKNQREIASALGISPASVNRRLKEMQERREYNA